MDHFDVTRGNVTYSIPTEIEVEGEKAYLDDSSVKDQREDYDGNLCGIELRFETQFSGKIALFIKTSYNELIASYGTLAEDESVDGIDYEHPEDQPYDLLPEGEICDEFKDNIIITQSDDLEDINY